MPEDGQVTVIVRLRSKATLAGSQHGSPAQRQRTVIDELRQTASVAQAPLRSLLDARRRQRTVASYKTFWVFDGFSVTATPSVIDELSKRPEVESITPDGIDIVPTDAPTAPARDEHREGEGAHTVDSGLRRAGCRCGQPRLRRRRRLIPISPRRMARWSQLVVRSIRPARHTDRSDRAWHGERWVSWSEDGPAGTSIGMAPGATWIAGAVFNDAGTATASAIHSALQWVLDPDREPVHRGRAKRGQQLVGVRKSRLQPRIPTSTCRPSAQRASFRSSLPATQDPARRPASALPTTQRRCRSAQRISTTRSMASAPGSVVRVVSHPARYPDVVAPGVNINTTERFGMYASGPARRSPPHTLPARSRC